MSEERLLQRYVTAVIERNTLQKAIEQGIQIPAQLYSAIVARKNKMVKLIAEGGMF